MESQWQVAGGWEQLLFSPSLHPGHGAAPICQQKLTSGCYSSKNGVCLQFSCRQDWGAPRQRKEAKALVEVTQRKRCCIFVRNLTSWASWVLLCQLTNCGVNFWWPYFPPCLGFLCSITWRISPKKLHSYSFQKKADALLSSKKVELTPGLGRGH